MYRGAGRPILSFELSRPTNEKAAQKLEKAIETLKMAAPDYVSVTFGAGGSTREGSLELIRHLKAHHGFEVVAYLACVGLDPREVERTLNQFKAMEVDTVFAIRGDAPTWEESYAPHPGALSHASDLLAFIKARHSFCLGAAGYPEGHLEAESTGRDLDFLKLKVERGAEYVVAQYCYDNRHFFGFVERARTRGIEVPIIPGIMPIYNEKLTRNLARICGATIPGSVEDQLTALDKKALAQFGVEFAAEQCRELLDAGVPGLHFYTMNRGKTVARVVETLRAEKRL